MVLAINLDIKSGRLMVARSVPMTELNLFFFFGTERSNQSWTACHHQNKIVAKANTNLQLVNWLFVWISVILSQVPWMPIQELQLPVDRILTSYAHELWLKKSTHSFFLSMTKDKCAQAATNIFTSSLEKLESKKKP